LLTTIVPTIDTPENTLAGITNQYEKQEKEKIPELVRGIVLPTHGCPCPPAQTHYGGYGNNNTF